MCVCVRVCVCVCVFVWVRVFVCAYVCFECVYLCVFVCVLCVDSWQVIGAECSLGPTPRSWPWQWVCEGFGVGAWAVGRAV